LTLTTLTFVLGSAAASALIMMTATTTFMTAALTVTALTMVHGEPRLYCVAGVFLALMARSIAIFQGFRSAPGYLRRATPSSADPI
jgi:hypothetical protein